MRVCDVCMLPGDSDMRSIQATAKNGSYGTGIPVWESTTCPDFCSSCLALLKALDWKRLGELNGYGMERYVADLKQPAKAQPRPNA